MNACRARRALHALRTLRTCRSCLLRSACVLMAMVVMSAAQAQQTTQALNAQTRQAQAQRRQLQADIQALHKKITASENARQEVILQLRTSEQAISTQVRQMVELNAQQRQLAREVAVLSRQIETQKHALASRQQALGRQLQARYAQHGINNTAPGATDFWATLLSGRSPQAIGRELAYLGYVSQAQADGLRSVQQMLDALSTSQANLRTRQQAQAKLLAQTAQQKKDLERQHAEREQVLIRINAQLREQRNQIDNLKRDEQRLNALVQGLEQTLVRQAEQVKKQAAQARQQQNRQQRTASAASASAPRSGLQKNLPYPVKGQVQGRFGAERPDGGVWRGIVLLAKEGVSVHAIASGTVVYADWLKGFGNMIIVDHGQEYMSIYAYNQGLLKSVGDSVAANEAIATVGATGGQVQAGLYFEIRHKGVPVNPLLWVRR